MWDARKLAISVLYKRRPEGNHKLTTLVHGPSQNRRMHKFAYLEVVRLLIVEVVVVVREDGPPDQGGDLWTGKEFERGPQKAAFDSHLHPQGHGQQLLPFPALLGLPDHSTLFLTVQPQFLGEHGVGTPDLLVPAEPGKPGCQAWEAQLVRQQTGGSCVCPACRGLGM